MNTLANFDADQARAEDGKWSSGSISPSVRRIGIDEAAAKLKAKGHTLLRVTAGGPKGHTTYDIKHPSGEVKPRTAHDIMRYLSK